MKLSRRIIKFASGVAAKLKPSTEEQGIYGNIGTFIAKRFPAVNDDLVVSKGAAIYREMRYDPEIKGALSVMSAGILSRGWEIEEAVHDGEPDYQQASDQADFIEWAFNRMPGSLDDILEELLRDAHCYGTAIPELVWEYLNDGDYPGSWAFAAIKPKDPNVYEFEIDDFCNVTKLWLNCIGGRRDVDVEKFPWFTLNSEHGQPTGTSELRAAYKWYWVKNQMTKYWAIFLEKYGSPTAKGSYKRGTPKAAQAELIKVLQSIQQETAIAVPDDVIVELMTTNTMITGGGYETFINYCDKQIVKALLGQTLTSGEGTRVGSMALGKVHQDILDILIKRLKRKTEEYVDEKWIRPLIDLNFSTPMYPNFTLTIDEKDIARLSESIFRLISCEAVDPQEGWIREYLGLPKREESTEAVEPQKTNLPEVTE